MLCGACVGGEGSDGGVRPSCHRPYRPIFLAVIRLFIWHHTRTHTHSLVIDTHDAFIHCTHWTVSPVTLVGYIIIPSLFHRGTRASTACQRHTHPTFPTNGPTFVDHFYFVHVPFGFRSLLRFTTQSAY